MNTIAEAEVSTIVAVLERIEQALKTTAVPLDQALWSAEEVANYLKVAERTVSESYALRRGFPAAIVLSQGKGRTQFTPMPSLDLSSRAQAESGTGPTAMCECSTATLSKSEKPF